MYRVLDKLPGPSFDFLVLKQGQCWVDSRRNRGIKPEYFHHPDSLRISDAVVSAFASCFRDAHAGFNYYGPTEFTGGNLAALAGALSAWRQAIASAQDAGSVAGLLHEDFLSEAEASGVCWPDDWNAVRSELVTTVGRVLERALAAQASGDSLVVLGI